ncbi:MAG: preprotein translocase subunit YajC [Neomegalonema sp.]|nr:preprotein translocase subunit YajC [Neomegalonema sp.]
MQGLAQLLPFVAIFAIMYFLIIRPQQKRMKQHREMIENLRRGDEVVTQGGLFAKITKVKEGEVEVEAEIAEGVKVRLVKGTIAEVVSKTEPAAAKS